MSLDTILDPATIKSIENSGKLVFHSVGDTGGVNTPTYIEGVSRFMELDMAFSKRPDRPSFFYHLGDVVYYDGESANYWPEFYEPYLNYHAPIVAIPGNHDGDVNPVTGESSLQAFVRNFCAQSATISPDNLDAPRRTMTQPNVFWTMSPVGDDHRHVQQLSGRRPNQRHSTVVVHFRAQSGRPFHTDNSCHPSSDLFSLWPTSRQHAPEGFA
jgi:hypothetical protein